MSDLIELLKSKYFNFDFFQAVALLEEYFGSEVPLETGKVRFYADAGQKFPASDIASVQKSSSSKIKFYLSFMGLIGISSPLPQHYLDHALWNSKENCGLSSFLNIFDHRLYSLFYEAWKKYRPIPTWSKKNDFDFFNRIVAVSGLNLDDQKSKDSLLLKYAGLFASVNRNADSLAEILTDCFSGTEVTIEQWAPRWANVVNKKELGRSITIGNGAMLGERIFDRSGKLLVHIDVSEKCELKDFLPDSANIKRIKEIVTLFSPQPLSFDIQLNFTSSNLIPVELGINSTQLGISSSCGSTENTKSIFSITIPGKA